MIKLLRLSAALLTAAAILSPTAASATTLGSTVVPVPAAHRPHTVLGSTFTPTPVLQGRPRWKPNTRVSYSLAHFTTVQAKIVRSALKENGKAIRVTYYEVTKGAKLRIFRHKLYSSEPDGSRTALPEGVVGLGGPSWTGNGVIVAGKVEVSPRADKLSGPQYRSLVLHEVGHASGLDHSEHTTSVMYPALQPDSPGHYSAEDLASLKPRT